MNSEINSDIVMFAGAFNSTLQYRDIAGTPENNPLVGSDRAERLAGFGGNDYANGGGGQDIFVLADFGGSYYTQQGWNDSLYIADFTAGEDKLQLNATPPGTASRYTSELGNGGLWLYDQGDAIAFLLGTSSFDFDRDTIYLQDLTLAPGLAEPVQPVTEQLVSEETGLKETDLKETGQEKIGSEAVVSEAMTATAERPAEFFSQLGIPQYEDIVGSLADDQLIGNGNQEKLIGFGGNDYAAGGSGADLFILGDFGSSYYAQNGWQDSIYIEDFTVGVDQLQLQGSADRYTAEADQSGTWLYDQGDAIAYLKNVSTLNLNEMRYLSL
ncbi:MAG: hypothetical protein AAF171_20305 [Cyanobacteria bacterium P01_A01_bin.116]